MYSARREADFVMSSPIRRSLCFFFTVQFVLTGSVRTHLFGNLTYLETRLLRCEAVI